MDQSDTFDNQNATSLDDNTQELSKTKDNKQSDSEVKLEQEKDEPEPGRCEFKILAENDEVVINNKSVFYRKMYKNP